MLYVGYYRLMNKAHIGTTWFIGYKNDIIVIGLWLVWPKEAVLCSVVTECYLHSILTFDITFVILV